MKKGPRYVAIRSFVKLISGTGTSYSIHTRKISQLPSTANGPVLYRVKIPSVYLANYMVESMHISKSSV